MRHTFLHNLAWARVADLHRQAERDRIARAAIRAPRAQAQSAPVACPLTPPPASRAGCSC